MPSEVWEEITYPSSDFNGCTDDVWEWISKFIPHFMMDVINFHAGIKVKPGPLKGSLISMPYFVFHCIHQLDTLSGSLSVVIRCNNNITFQLFAFYFTKGCRLVLLYLQNKTEVKWQPFNRGHLIAFCLEWKSLCFNCNFVVICFQKPSQYG